VLDENTAYVRILGEVRSDGGERLYAYGPEGFSAQQTVGGGVEYPLLDGLGRLHTTTTDAAEIGDQPAPAPSLPGRVLMSIMQSMACFCPPICKRPIQLEQQFTRQRIRTRTSVRLKTGSR